MEALLKLGVGECQTAVLHNYGNQTNPTFTIRLMALQGPDQLDVLTKKRAVFGSYATGHAKRAYLGQNEKTKPKASFKT